MADAKAKYNKLSNAQVIKVSKWLGDNWDRLKKDKIAREALVAEIQTATGAAVNWGQLLRHCREDYDEPKNLAEICVGGRATGDVARSDRPRRLAEQLLLLIDWVEALEKRIYGSGAVGVHTVDRDLLRRIARARRSVAPKKAGGQLPFGEDSGG